MQHETSDGSDAEAPPSRVLVVDDDDDSAESLARLVQVLGHVGLTADDGPSAIESVRGFRPRIVLLDIGLPGMSGYEVARQIRELPEGQDVILVAVTGWDDAEARQRALEAGFQHHVVKPVDVQKLRKILRGEWKSADA